MQVRGPQVRDESELVPMHELLEKAAEAYASSAEAALTGQGLEEGAAAMIHPVLSVLDRMQEVVESKAHDYAQDDNVFSNFEYAADVAGISVDQEFMVMIGTKVARIREIMGGKTPNNESLDDSLMDLANYAALMLAYRWKREGEI